MRFLPDTWSPASSGRTWKYIRGHLNFYRVHILFFTLTPLIFSGIFYASNGRFKIAYIDALYNSVSAMTVCGLATVNLSSLTAWQQTILFLQMCLGSPVVVSWFMVYIRRYYFAKKFDHVIEAQAARRAAQRMDASMTRRSDASRDSHEKWSRRVPSILRRRTGLHTVLEDVAGEETHASRNGDLSKKSKKGAKLQTNMIRRVDTSPQRIDPNGWISELDGGSHHEMGPELLLERDDEGQEIWRPEVPPHSDIADEDQESVQEADLNVPETSFRQNLSTNQVEGGDVSKQQRRLSDPGSSSQKRSASTGEILYKASTLHSSSPPRELWYSRTAEISPVHRQSLEFAPSPTKYDSTVTAAVHKDPSSVREMNAPPRSAPPRVPLAQNMTAPTDRSVPSRVNFSRSSRRHSHVGQGTSHLFQERGFGGFPMPHEIFGMIFEKVFPNAKKKLKKTLTIPLTTTVTSQYPNALDGSGNETHDIAGGKSVPYISFDAIVGRNSVFHLLTNEQLEELGGVEYRALNALLWLVAVYHIGVQLLSFVVIAPYMTLGKWQGNFVPPQQYRVISSTWFSLFQVVSAYSNTGTSLVDQSMVPFQTAYPMIFFMIFCILAGNTAFPVFLRFFIWIITKFVSVHSRINETLHFLLDHPRRCFIYLFPSHQTWLLLIILIMLNGTDFLAFLILDIGNPTIEAIPVGTRIVAALLQGVSVRAAGFGIVTLSTLSPAVQVLYVVMMYISVYPIAMSVRSTNVYEEQSLGIFKDDDEQEDEPTMGHRVTVWSRYLAMHARKQLAFDMWWLALALILVCIIERGNLNDESLHSWFNIFSIMFELVSAYGSVGLSLGIPTENYSLSGAFRPLSKLIVCAVMLRGRHRGLPVAIDRAVMLPFEFHTPQNESPPEHELQDRQSRRQSSQCGLSDDAPLSTYPTTDSSLDRSSLNEYDKSNPNEDKLRQAGRRRSQDALLAVAREKALREDRASIGSSSRH